MDPEQRHCALGVSVSDPVPVPVPVPFLFVLRHHRHHPAEETASDLVGAIGGGGADIDVVLGDGVQQAERRCVDGP
jgi:hypothetical protein